MEGGEGGHSGLGYSLVCLILSFYDYLDGVVSDLNILSCFAEFSTNFKSL